MASVYIHVPFCTQRCSYCDFYFVTTASTHAPFVDAVVREITYYGSVYPNEKIKSIYFGGGTPSLLAPADIFQVLEAVNNSFDTTAVVESTLELNPEDSDSLYLNELRRLGFNRLCIGVQSFFEDDLTFMNRSHSVEDSSSCIDKAQRAGFDNISIDLIFGLPEQPIEYWGANLEKAIALNIPHISTYGLTIEERTPLHKMIQKGDVAPLGEDEMADRYNLAMSLLRSAGYEHYEISSFAKPGFRSKHNSGYWQHQNYFGFGPSAHSFVFNGLPATRWSNIRNLNRWHALLNQNQAPIEMKEKIDLDTLANEYILLQLRTIDGLNMGALADRYGVDMWDERVDDIAWLEEGGYIEPVRNDIVKLTDTGRLLCDMVTSKLVLG